MRPSVFTLHGESEDAHWWFVARRHVLEPLVCAAMAGREADLIIDVGCGTGGTVAALGRKYRCLGIDQSRQAIEIAHQKYPNSHFIEGSVPDHIRGLGQETALFTVMDVLEHIEDDRRFLADLIPVVRPGAHILVTVPAEPDLWSEHDVAAGHMRRYDEASLAALWANLPVKPRVFSFFNARLFPLIWLIRHAERIFPALFRRGSDLEMPNPVVNAIMRMVFSGERSKISSLLADVSVQPYRRGVSLVVLLQRT